MRGKRWLLLTRWRNLTAPKRTQLKEALALNRRLFKAYYPRSNWSGCGPTATKGRRFASSSTGC